MQNTSATYQNNSFGAYLTSKNTVSNPRINYIYGFNGMEKDDEAKGKGNSYDFEARFYDSRLGRFLSVDAYASKFPYQSPYVGFDNNPIIYTDPTGDYSIEVIKHDDGTMELKLVTVGYVEGRLAEEVLNDFHAVYPSGYTRQGVYIDNSGVKWTITVHIDIQNYSGYESDKASGSVIDTDCLPAPQALEEAYQYGNFVCSSFAGPTLHGLWHNTGGDDCYGAVGFICDRLGLMENPEIRYEDFIRIGYNYIDYVPERLNGMENKSEKSMVDFIQENGALNIGKNKINSMATSAFFWYHNAGSYPGGSKTLFADQLNRQQEYINNGSNSTPSDAGETEKTQEGGASTRKFD